MAEANSVKYGNISLGEDKGQDDFNPDLEHT